MIFQTHENEYLYHYKKIDSIHCLANINTYKFFSIVDEYLLQLLGQSIWWSRILMAWDYIQH